MARKEGSFSDRMFRALMRLFPFEFRGEFQGEMEGVFREERTDVERREGLRGIARLWWITLTGIFRTAPREHIEMFRQDGAYALRMMAKQPGFTAIALLTLALGIGSNTAIFSVIYGVLLRPLPYRDGQSVVVLTQPMPGLGSDDIGFSVKEIDDYRAQNHSLDSLVEYHNMSFMLVGHGEPQRVATGVVSPEFFEILGIKPEIGRFFLPEDDKPGAPNVLVLSYGYWERQMGSDTNIIGKVLSMNGRAITVVGVMPAIPQYPDQNDVYMPTSACPFRSNPDFVKNRDARMMNVFARLKPGVSLEHAQADLSVVASRLAASYPNSYPPQAKFTAHAERLQTELGRQARTTLLLLLAAAGMVLLIACANVANLTLSRLLRRDREMAVRAALGAGPARILRQLLTESTLLALGGGALGLVFAALGLDVLVRFAARFTPRTGEIRLDGAVLAFTAVVAVGTGIIFGSLPAMSRRRDPADALQGGSKGTVGGGRRNRLRSLLVVSQVAISFTLLAGAGLMIHSVYNLQHVDAGFRPDHVLTMLLELDWSRYNDPSGAKSRAFFDSLLTRVSAMPGVVESSVALRVPLNESAPFARLFQIEGRPVPTPADRPRANWHNASTNYFRTIGIPLMRGRFFTDADGPEAAPVVIVNQTMARHYWGEKDPVGQRISFDNGDHWAAIVGIVGDTRDYGLERPPGDEIYRPYAQASSRLARLLLRTGDDPMKLAKQVTSIVYEIDPKQPVAEVRTLEQIRTNSLTASKLTALLLALFAGLALAITGAGLAGVMALSVSQRTQEIGIRMALGATPRLIFGMVLTQGLGMVALGAGIGAVGAFGVSRLMSALLFGVGEVDWITFGAVIVALLAIAAVSCFLPARRAANVAPIVALRYE
jgi:putative ABC transport system permease protein